MTSERSGTQTSSLHVGYKPESLISIEKHKTRGNEAHAAKKYSTAVSEYSKGIALLFTTPSPQAPRPVSPSTVSAASGATSSPVSQTDAASLLAQLLSNRSASYLQERNFAKALEDGQEAVKHLAWYKPWYRQGEAFIGLYEYQKAIQAFRKALQFVGPVSSSAATETARRSRVDQISKRLQRAEVMLEDESHGFRIHQLSPAKGDLCAKKSLAPIQNLIFSYARQMQNLIYLIENIASKECLVVDACWDVDGIVKYAEKRGLKIRGAIVTHYHVDHVGGIPPPPFDLPGIRVEGLVKLLKKLPNIPAHVNPADIPGILKANPEIDVTRLKGSADGETMWLPMALNTGLVEGSLHKAKGSLGRTAVDGRTTLLQFVHTPGHSPGSQCILINGNRLLSGDTLFIRSCGRVDFPDSDLKLMHESLQDKLAKLPEHVVVFPGHDYGGDLTTIQEEKRNGVLRPQDFASFKMMMADAKDGD
ncbi:hypothetical protein HKX48_003775 [Thoreauomyces humboldtii]|nr:hypothetical protein HKX48_003775 [Thoreauomyces humboldtii]